MTGMQREGVVQRRVSQGQLPGFESQPQLFPAVCYWPSYSTSLCLIFLTGKVRIAMGPPSQGCPEDRGRACQRFSTVRVFAVTIPGTRRRGGQEPGCAGLVGRGRNGGLYLKWFSAERPDMTVGKGESRPSTGGGRHPQRQPGPGMWDSGPNIARPSNHPKEARN